MINTDPMKYLEQQYNTQLQSMSQIFGQQEEAIENQSRTEWNNLNAQYDIERKYIEITPGEAEQKKKALLQLNKRYELKWQDAQAKLQPYVQKLQTERATAQTKLDQQMAKTKMEVEWIGQLMADGTISNPRAGLARQLQAVGVDVTKTDLMPLEQPSPQQQLDMMTKELTAAERVISKFYPPYKKDPLMYQEQPEADWQPATEKQKEMYDLLTAYTTKLRQDIGAGLSGGAFRMGRAMSTAADMQGGDPFTKQAQQLVEKLGRPKKRPNSGAIKTARNPQTGERIISRDGGATWQKM